MSIPTAGAERQNMSERIRAHCTAAVDLTAGQEAKLDGVATRQITNVFAVGDKAIGRVYKGVSAGEDVVIDSIFREIYGMTTGANVTAGQGVVLDANRHPIPFDPTAFRAARASIDLAGLVTTQGDLRAAIGGVNVDTTLPVDTDPVQAALMVVDAINKDAVVGLLVRAWLGVAAAADGGVARGNIGLAGTVTTGGDLRGTVDGVNIDVTLAVGDTPAEAAEMWANAFNVHADLGDDFLAWVTSADADALLGARAVGAVQVAVDGTGGATLTITLDGTAVQLVPGAGEFPDAFADRMTDACNETVAINDRFMFTTDAETPGTGGIANIRIWAKHPGSVYNVTLVAATTDATMTAVASGANLTNGADITEATIHIRALKPGAAYNVALASSAEAGLVGLVPTASGAALTEGSDDAAATVFLEARYPGAAGNAITLIASQEGGLVGMVPTASTATFTDGAPAYTREAIYGMSLTTATSGNLADIGVY